MTRDKRDSPPAEPASGPRPWVIITITIIVLVLIGASWLVPLAPRLIIELIVLSLFCPGFNSVGGSCMSSPADFVLPWAILLGIVAVIVLLIRRAARR